MTGLTYRVWFEATQAGLADADVAELVRWELIRAGWAVCRPVSRAVGRLKDRRRNA